MEPGVKHQFGLIKTPKTNVKQVKYSFLIVLVFKTMLGSE